MSETVKQALRNIHAAAEEINRPVRLMEVCGTHTMAAFRTGLRALLPDTVTLLSGPGCPVCVTPNAYIDHAIALSLRSDTVVATFGDMVRVPGTERSLEYARAQGGSVIAVYSPLEALRMAQQEPHKQIVFLGVGFETTVPAVAWTLREAYQSGVENYSVLCAHKLIPPAMDTLLRSQTHIDGFICPGHVSVIIGEQAYTPLCQQHHVPCVITGFEAIDMMQGILLLLRQLIEERAEVQNQYSRTVTPQGNAVAQELIDQVYTPCDAQWRGLGTIPASGLAVREPYYADAAKLALEEDLPQPRENPLCRCGDVLRGIISPPACPLFATACSPLNPIGPCMVSSEGTCAAYYRYAR
ncbi:MAG: hydrogenase formation protein HypD [Candidatus Electrothrix sp. AX5]|nr:hydrogenase formation protein HypD [Candidatus Electrothrix sp. AX5]